MSRNCNDVRSSQDTSPGLFACLHECDAYGKHTFNQEEPPPTFQTVMKVELQYTDRQQCTKSIAEL
jgi:hypothetical protein